MSNSISQIEKLIEKGQYFEARSKAEFVLTESNELRTKQLYALALSKSGVPEAALEFMEPVYSAFSDDPESAGIMGSIYKELFKKNQNNSFAIKARDTYLKNFTATKNYYTGINAAAMSAMAGQSGKSREIASEVISLLQEEPKDFWVSATLGEAYLLTKDKPNAVSFYVQARKEAGMDWGKIISVHNQLWLLNHFIAVPNDIIKLFTPPGVVAFAGHMIDHPQRKEARFPLSIEQKMKEAIRHTIRSLNVHIGYCSLACGSDILFAEAMAEEGREVNIFLPFDKSDFIKTSVQFAGSDWVNRFNELITKFPVHYLSTESYSGLDDIFSFQTKVIFGSAALRSQSYHDKPKLLTVQSDVDLKRKEGGTRDSLALWPFPKNSSNINPDLFLTDRTVAAQPIESSNELERPTDNRPVLYLVCCDLSEPSAEWQKILDYDKDNLGDGAPTVIYEAATSTLLAAFTTESASIEFVRFAIASTKSLKSQVPYKISLHAGPVNVDSHESEGSKKLSGKTVDQIIEMNKLTTKHSVFASEQFAACLALNNALFSIEYGGFVNFREEEQKISVYRVSFK